ncbi:MAG: hypothetical protein WAQ98_12750 [Blastocatellia bacterium]
MDHINQHQIEIGLPQLDNADRHIILSQNGNASNPIDLSKYSSIDIIEISQQPTAARQREDINIEPALARNQERLSDFYQSYKNEDSSIDWSKVATKITLSNTSGTFYDHEDKYTTGLKIEFSTQGVESIEFRDGTTSETITTLSASELPATMVIGNLCKIGPLPGTAQGTFCSPTLIAAEKGVLQPAQTAIWSLCSLCNTLYNTEKPSASACFGNLTGNSGFPYGSHNNNTSYKPFYLPINDKPWQYKGINIQYCGLACEQCGMLVCNSISTPPSGTTFVSDYNCPGGNVHVFTDYQNAYWVQTETPTETSKNLGGFLGCINCGGLVKPPNPNDILAVPACVGNKTGTPVDHYLKEVIGSSPYSITESTSSTEDGS